MFHVYLKIHCGPHLNFLTEAVLIRVKTYFFSFKRTSKTSYLLSSNKSLSGALGVYMVYLLSQTMPLYCTATFTMSKKLWESALHLAYNISYLCDIYCIIHYINPTFISRLKYVLDIKTLFTDTYTDTYILSQLFHVNQCFEEIQARMKWKKIRLNHHKHWFTKKRENFGFQILILYSILRDNRKLRYILLREYQ